MTAPEQLLPRRTETAEQSYLRQIRNATMTLAIIALVVAVLALVGMIVTAAQLAHLSSSLNNSINGTVPSCSVTLSC